MKQQKQWSQTLRDKTELELTHMVTCGGGEGEAWLWVLGTSTVPYARFKHIGGKKLGKMSVENAHANYKNPGLRSYIIQCDDGTEEKFATVDDLLNTGWALD